MVFDFLNKLSEPMYRKAATDAKDHCLSDELSGIELSMVRTHNWSKNTFVSERNALKVMIFNTFIGYLKRQASGNPNATFDLLHAQFQQRIHHQYDSADDELREKYLPAFMAASVFINPEDAASSLTEKVAGISFDKLNDEARREMENLTKTYIDEISDFLKKRIPALSR